MSAPAPADRLPADLYGRHGPDLAFALVDALATVRLRWARLAHRRGPDLRADAHTLALVVSERRIEARDQDVVSLRLRARDGGELPAWRPGAHLDLTLPSGRRRQYSLCGDPADRGGYRIAVRRIPGGSGSVEVHDALRVGSPILARGPRNAFPFAVPGHGSPSTRLHFVAGGIGITPILPMARLAGRLGVDWSMVYVGRSCDTLPFLDEIAAFGDRVTVRADDEYGLPDAAALLPGVRAGDAVYCCGPAPLTATVVRAVGGMTGVEMHSERFSPPPIVDGRPFEIELARTGEVLPVPADESALTALLKLRPDLPYSCRQGFCRTCEVRVLAGAPDHRDATLTAAERASGSLLPCVSRCHAGRLVVDL